MTWRHHLAGVLLVSLLGAACAALAPENGSPGTDDSGEGTESESTREVGPEGAAATVEGENEMPMSDADRREMRRKLAERSPKAASLERAPGKAKDELAVTGEVPEEILDAILADLAEITDTAPDTIEVLHDEAVTWDDGSLGCPEPDQAYMPMPVPGYRVILGHEGQQFDYRASEKGTFRLCEQPHLAAPGAGREPPVD